MSIARYGAHLIYHPQERGKMNKKTSYEKYVALRDKKGVTDYAVAKATGLHDGQFSNWKAKRYAPKVDKLQKLAEYFEVPLTDLLGD